MLTTSQLLYIEGAASCCDTAMTSLCSIFAGSEQPIDNSSGGGQRYNDLFTIKMKW